MFEDILTEEQQSILEILKRRPFINLFYLAGGTGLALHLGHRRSLDFDFFTQTEFQASHLLSQIQQVEKVLVAREAKDTLTIDLRGTQTCFFKYDYPLLRPLLTFKQTLKIADIPDIAAMKLSAVSGRGSKKDFIDLFFVCKRFPLKELLGFLRKKYETISYSEYHILKSLIYFDDAEEEPMPEMIHHINWPEVKAFFIREVKYLFDIK